MSTRCTRWSTRWRLFDNVYLRPPLSAATAQSQGAAYSNNSRIISFSYIISKNKKIYLTYDMWGSVLRSTSHQKAFRFLCRGDSTASSRDPPKNNPGLEMLIASSSAHVCSTARVDRSHCPQWPQETAQMTKMMTTSNCHCWQPLLKQK